MAKKSEDKSGPAVELDPSATVDTNAGPDAVMGTVADNGPGDAGEPMAPEEAG